MRTHMTLEYIRQSFFFFRQNIKLLAAINIPFLIIFNILFSQINMAGTTADPNQVTQSLLMASTLNLLFMPIYWGATIFFMQSTINSPVFTAGQAIAASIKTWSKLFLVFLITSVCVLFGFMAFIIPGIYVAIRLSLSHYICIVENKGTIDSLKQSWARTDDYIWLILKGTATIMITIFILRMAAIGIADAIFNSALINIIVNITFDFCNIMVMIFGFRVYCLSNEKK